MYRSIIFSLIFILIFLLSCTDKKGLRENNEFTRAKFYWYMYNINTFVYDKKENLFKTLEECVDVQSFHEEIETQFKVRFKFKNNIDNEYGHDLRYFINENLYLPRFSAGMGISSIQNIYCCDSDAPSEIYSYLNPKGYFESDSSMFFSYNFYKYMLYHRKELCPWIADYYFEMKPIQEEDLKKYEYRTMVKHPLDKMIDTVKYKKLNFTNDYVDSLKFIMYMINADKYFVSKERLIPYSSIELDVYYPKKLEKVFMNDLEFIPHFVDSVDFDKILKDISYHAISYYNFSTSLDEISSEGGLAGIVNDFGYSYTGEIKNNQINVSELNTKNNFFLYKEYFACRDNLTPFLEKFIENHKEQ